MLREVKNAALVPRGWFWRRYVLRAGKNYIGSGIKPDVFAQASAEQEKHAAPVAQAGGRQYWWCIGRFYWEDDGLSAKDVYALVYERQRRKERQIERAHAVVATDSSP